MQITVREFHLPKAGSSAGEYEDAFDHDEQAKRLAIADGASDAFESRLWAQTLVQMFVRQPPMPNFNGILDWLTAPIKLWKEGINWEKLPWYSAEKARRGAFSTLLGLYVGRNELPSTLSAQEPDCCRWTAVAVGDTCLFQVREDQLLVSFPLQIAADFGTTPALISTRLDYTQRSLEALQVLEGDCRSGDVLIIGTDSFSAWFLSRRELGEHPWLRLSQLDYEEEFRGLIDHARAEGQMRNDDVTLLILDFKKNPAQSSDQLAGMS
jgi:hypothetical protein